MGTMRTPLRDVATGAAATIAVLGILVGVPAALVAGVGWPLPSDPVSLDTVVTALRYGQIAPSTLLRALAVVLWITWGLVTISILLEVVAVARGTVARALPGLEALQTGAARLVATVMLLTSMATRAAATPHDALPPMPPVATEIVTPVEAPGPVSVQPTAATAETHVWTVQRRDSLWTIAERTLGDGHRWKDIAALNEGRPQPDGTRLRPGDTLIRPGWRLALPTDAEVDVAPAKVTVARGDDLWSIAAEHLDDGDRWPEIFAHNKGHRQPGGGRLSDPDVIRPGWVLRMPPSARKHNDAVDGNDAAAPPRRPTDPTPTPEPATPSASQSSPEPPDDAPEPPEPPDVESEPPDAAPQPSEPPDAASEPQPDIPPPVTPSSLQPTAAPAPPAPEPTSDATTRPTAAANPSARATEPPVPATTDQPRPTTSNDTGAVVVVGAALLAAALIALVTRRRRHWLQRRPVGAALDPVDPEAAELERWLRSMADHDLHVRLDRVLRVLTEHFAEYDVAPAVAAVEFGAQVTLRVAAPDANPPPGLTASDDGRRWTLEAGIELGPAAERRYLPALISCGRLASGDLLLLNLLDIGVLGVAGPNDDIGDALTSWAAELAASGAAGGVEIVVVGAHHPLVEWLARVTIADDVAGALARVQRIVDTADEVAGHIVVLCGNSDDAAVDALVEAADHPRVAVVLPNDQHGNALLEVSGAHVRLRPDSDAWFDAPEWLSPQDWDRFGDLLRQPEHHQLPDPVPSPLLAVGTLDPADPITDPITAHDDAEQTQIGVLGSLTVAGRPAAIDPDAAAVLTYLASHPTGGDPASIATTLWPSQPDRDDRLEAAATALDAALADLHGGALVVHTDDGRLELSALITTDLRVFDDLLRHLDQQTPAVQARRLYTALELVRGEPFMMGAEWAHADGLAIQATGLIIDTAHRLAMQALTVGDVERADWAVDAGLRAAPQSELLFRDRMRIAAARGDSAAIDASLQELKARVEADDGWITAETFALYEQLRGPVGAIKPEDRQKDAS